MGRRAAVVFLAPALLSVAVLVSGCGTPCSDIGLYTINPDGTGKQHRVKTSMQLYDAMWVSDGTRIAASDGCRWWIMDANGSHAHTLSRQYVRVSKALMWFAENGTVRGFTVSDSRGVKRKLVTRAHSPASACRATQIAVPEAEVSPTLSQDGRYIAYPDGSEVVDGQVALNIYTVSARGGPIRRLTHSTLRDSAPTWSPNDKLVAFVRESPDDTSIFAINSDGTGLRRIADNSDEVAWSPDGRELVVAGNPTGDGAGLYIVDIRGHVIRRLNVQRSSFSLSWAPAHTIAYVYDRGNEDQQKCGD